MDELSAFWIVLKWFVFWHIFHVYSQKNFSHIAQRGFRCFERGCVFLLLCTCTSYEVIYSTVCLHEAEQPQRRTHTSSFSSTEVNLLTGSFPVQTLQTGLIRRSLAALESLEPSELWCLFLDQLLNRGCCKRWWKYPVFVPVLYFYKPPPPPR